MGPWFKIGWGGNWSYKNCLKNSNCLQPPRWTSFMGKLRCIALSSFLLDRVLQSHFSHQNHPHYYPVLYVRNLKASEVKELIQGHPAKTDQSLDWSPIMSDCRVHTRDLLCSIALLVWSGPFIIHLPIYSLIIYSVCQLLISALVILWWTRMSTVRELTF